MRAGRACAALQQRSPDLPRVTSYGGQIRADAGDKADLSEGLVREELVLARVGALLGALGPAARRRLASERLTTRVAGA